MKKVKNVFHTLPSNPWFSVRECPKILKICQITKLDMGFQKKNISSRSENIDFFESYRFLRQCLLNKLNLNINFLSNGVYYLKAKSQNTMNVVKIIKN